ncbi:MAG TPA: hypothetical protein VFY71_14895, partial [Planctomycetota bacterium]|nr:hypothetical protein [Planctomycetota bacterium]
VAAALTPGADTTLVADRFLVWVLRHGRCGLDENCARVAALYADRLLEPSGDTWRQAMCAAARAARAAAYAAYASDAAARAASDAAAYAAAARAASDAAAYAAAYAADAAAAAYAAYAAAGKVAFWRDAADVLIEVLSRCEVVS